jgi:hypothetical protein
MRQKYIQEHYAEVVGQRLEWRLGFKAWTDVDYGCLSCECRARIRIDKGWLESAKGIN